MSDSLDIMPATAPALPLSELIGNRRPLQQIAAALKCTERSVYNLVDRYRIPYVRVLNKRYLDPKDVRDALLRDQGNAPVRRRGRPRRAA